MIAAERPSGLDGDEIKLEKTISDVMKAMNLTVTQLPPQQQLEIVKDPVGFGPVFTNTRSYQMTNGKQKRFQIPHSILVSHRLIQRQWRRI